MLKVKSVQTQNIKGVDIYYVIIENDTDRVYIKVQVKTYIGVLKLLQNENR